MRLQVATDFEIGLLEKSTSIDIHKPVIKIHDTSVSDVYLTNDKLFIEYIKLTNTSVLYTSLQSVLENVAIRTVQQGKDDITNLMDLNLPTGTYDKDKVVLDMLKNYMPYITRYLSRNKKNTRVKLYGVANANYGLVSLKKLFPHARINLDRSAVDSLLIHFPYSIL